MNDTIRFHDVNMLNNIVDSINDELRIERCELYKDFKFVTEKSDVVFKGPQLREVTYVSAGWNFMVLFLVMILLVINKFLAPQRFSSIIAMSFQSSGGEKMARDSQSFLNIISLSVIISFVILISMFVQRNCLIYGANAILYDNFDFFVDVATAVSALFVFTYLLTYFYGWLFKTDAFIHLYVNLHVSTMATCNMLLIPIILILLFYPYKFFSVFCIILLVIFYFIRFAKLLIETRMLSKLNFVNIFLYLCTIEILPVLVIIKMMVLLL